jgi:hypothetical protein
MCHFHGRSTKHSVVSCSRFFFFWAWNNFKAHFHARYFHEETIKNLPLQCGATSNSDQFQESHTLCHQQPTKMESRSFPAHEWLSDTLRDHLQPEIGRINIKIRGRNLRRHTAIFKGRRAYAWTSQPKLLTLPLKEWRTLMSLQNDSPFENPHNWLPSKILYTHYFTSQIYQILFSAVLKVPSTYLPTVHLPQFPVAYCTNHLP